MKPENVFLVQREGRPDFVKVLDFGIAKVVSADDNDGPRLTQTGMIFGTPEYMSPEQAQGHPPDHRVDVYAVGCIMYHMLTGAVPFTADSFMGILTKHLLEPVVPPRKRRPDLGHPGRRRGGLPARDGEGSRQALAGHGRLLPRARRGGRRAVRAVERLHRAQRRRLRRRR